MHTYRKQLNEDGTARFVTFYAGSPSGNPSGVTDMHSFENEADAIQMVNALNGGGPPPAPTEPQAAKAGAKHEGTEGAEEKESHGRGRHR